MKKLLSLALVLTMVLAFAVPVMAAATSDFIGGTVVTIDKNGYNNFDGREITANNSTTVFKDFSFIADNKTLNAWYIDVTDDISGTLEVAYKVSSAYYVVTFDIDGPGKYWIADSKGSNGANMVKVGAFKEAEVSDPLPLFLACGAYWQPLNVRTFNVGDPIDYSEYLATGEGWGEIGILLPEVSLINLSYKDTDGSIKSIDRVSHDDTIFSPAQGTILDQPGRVDITLTYAVAFSTDYDAYYDHFSNDPDFRLEDYGDGDWTLERYINEAILGRLDDDGYLSMSTWIDVKEAPSPTCFYLGIYGSGSIWPEWWFDNAIEVGGTWVKSDFEPEEYSFFAICDESKTNEVASDIRAPLVLGNSSVSGDYWGWDGNKYHVVLEIEWDGANNISVALISFTIVE
ncbi:MAG: hypothetical protein FWG53_00360 [Clostridiales bacterium]|nr:hypothetical protein [Clostridiales bacterium]